MADDDEIEKRVAELARLPAIQYARKRKVAAKELDCGGVRILDALVERERKHASRVREEFTFEQIEPWHKPVDGAALLDRIEALYRRHVVLNRFESASAALWTLYSYCYEAFDMSPILAIESATPRCGKTTLLSIIGRLVYRGISASNISPAAIYRFIESQRPTLLMDEADAWLRGNEEARSVLNSGHTRAAAIVIRCEGDDSKPKPFSTWCPKVIALIGKLPPTLLDRSIRIALQRKLSTDKLERYSQDKASVVLDEVRRQCLRWKRDNFAALRAWDGFMPDGLNDRACDNWRTLVAIADLAERSRRQECGPDAELWSALARSAARELSGFEREDPDLKAVLLADIDAFFRERNVARVSSQELAAHLGNLVDQPWSEWGRPPKAMSPGQLARQLEPLRIKPNLMRIGATPTRGYERAQFDDALRRYPPVQSVTPLQPKLFNDLGANQTVTTGQDVTVGNAANPLIDKACNGVTLSQGGYRDNTKSVDCATCLNFKRISAETGECTEHHDDAAPGAPRICRDYLPASSENAGDGRDGAPGNGLDASDRGTKITH